MTSRYSFEPIGVVRSPFVERASAPRQTSASPEASGGRIELFPGLGYEDALEGLADWEFAWVVFVFHRNVEDARGWRPKVQPPRSDTKRGVFATRSPHRPNPIGITSVKIERIEGLVLHVADLDMLDATPVLDLKPYVAYADAHPEARAGWLAVADPVAPWEVVFADGARGDLAWLAARGVDLEPAIRASLALGPKPHAYRRIRHHGAGMRLSMKDWRVDFAVEGADAALHVHVVESGAEQARPRRIVVTALHSGYRAKQLAEDPALALHRAFAGRFVERGGFPAG